jgi:hypothetical protein
MIEQDRIQGYRFVASMVPIWPEVSAFVRSRAQALGLYTGKDDDLVPRGYGCEVAGTHWLRFANEMRCNMYEYRSDIEGMIVAGVNLPLERLSHCYGLSAWRKLERPGLNRFALEHAVGLWQKNGSLVLQQYEYNGVTVPEQTITPLSLRTALSALASEAAGRTELTGMRSVVKGRTEVGTQPWAPTSKVSIRYYPEYNEVEARFLSPTWRTVIKLDLISTPPEASEKST